MNYLRLTALLDLDDLTIHQFHFSVPRMRIPRAFDSGSARVIGRTFWIIEYIVWLIDADFLTGGHGIYEGFFGFEVNGCVHTFVLLLSDVVGLGKEIGNKFADCFLKRRTPTENIPHVGIKPGPATELAHFTLEVRGHVKSALGRTNEYVTHLWNEMILTRVIRFGSLLSPLSSF